MSTHTQVATERLILRERTKELLADVLKRPERDQLFFFGYSDPADLQREHDMFEKGLSNWKMEFRWWDILEQGNKIVVGAAGYHSWYTDCPSQRPLNPVSVQSAESWHSLHVERKSASPRSACANVKIPSAVVGSTSSSMGSSAGGAGAESSATDDGSAVVQAEASNEGSDRG